MIRINEIEEMKQYLTKEEYNNLLEVKEMGVSVSWGWCPRDIIDVIDSSFIWKDTPQGVSYWFNIWDRLRYLYKH